MILKDLLAKGQYTSKNGRLTDPRPDSNGLCLTVSLRPSLRGGLLVH